MITIKHPKKEYQIFNDLVVGETFIVVDRSNSVDDTVYSKVSLKQDGANACNYATGLLARFSPAEEVILVDVVVEYSIRK